MSIYAIIGDGAAGTTAAYYLRRADPDSVIQILSDDPNPAYYRAALTNYLIGELREEQLFAVPPDFYEVNRITRVLSRVTEVDAANSRLTLSNGATPPYDQLLIGAGARPNPPAFPGSDLPGVMTMRTLQDARTVMDMIRAGSLKHAIVVGGGPLGIEWVQGLLTYNVKVTYLLRGDMFFERALDRTASDLVINRLRMEGVDVRTNEEIEEAVAGRGGRLQAVKLKNSKQTLDCQLIGAAIGIKPNTEFLEGSGITVSVDKRGNSRGIPVDETMRTNIPNVYAAGDILSGTIGLWEPARLQGRVVGMNMAGGSATHALGVHYNATRLFDLDFASVGETAEADGDQVMIDFPMGSGRIAYRKVIIRKGKLVGALMLGQRKEAVRKYGRHYKKLIEAGLDVSTLGDRMLDRTFDLGAWMEGMRPAEEKVAEIRAAQSVSDINVAAAMPAMADMRKTINGIGLAELLASAPPEEAEAAPAPAPAPARVAPMHEDLPAAVLIHDGKPIKLEARSMTLGRDNQADIVLNDLTISYLHAQITRTGADYYLLDLGSRNGTFVNGTLLSVPHRLTHGDEVRIGRVKLSFQLAGQPQRAVQPAERTVPIEMQSVNVYSLVVQSGATLGLSFGLTNPPLMVGRDPQSQIVVPDPTLSWQHARFDFDGRHWSITDLESRNGTQVNGQRLAANQPQQLSPDDQIALGAVQMRLEMVGQPEVAMQGRVMPERTAPIEDVEVAEFDIAPPPAPAPMPSPAPRSASVEVSDIDKTIRAPHAAPPPPPPPPKPRIAKITVIKGVKTGETFTFDEDTIAIGRAPENQIALPDGMMSRRHASLTRQGDDWFLTDLGSANGTWVNETQAAPEVEIQLAHLDQIHFGDVLVQFEIV